MDIQSFREFPGSEAIRVVAEQRPVTWDDVSGTFQALPHSRLTPSQPLSLAVFASCSPRRSPETGLRCDTPLEACTQRPACRHEDYGIRAEEASDLRSEEAKVRNHAVAVWKLKGRPREPTAD